MIKDDCGKRGKVISDIAVVNCEAFFNQHYIFSLLTTILNTLDITAVIPFTVFQYTEMEWETWPQLQGCKVWNWFSLSGMRAFSSEFGITFDNNVIDSELCKVAWSKQATVVKLTIHATWCEADIFYYATRLETGQMNERMTFKRFPKNRWGWDDCSYFVYSLFGDKSL